VWHRVGAVCSAGGSIHHFAHTTYCQRGAQHVFSARRVVLLQVMGNALICRVPKRPLAGSGQVEHANHAPLHCSQAVVPSPDIAKHVFQARLLGVQVRRIAC
jgi:hypothetical protein